MSIGRHKHKKIGLSLSFCVKDILLERVSLNQIAVIITGTNFDMSDVDKGIQQILDNYYQPYWDKFAYGKCMFVLKYLFQNNMVVQPRKRGNEFAPNIAKTHWLSYPTND